MPTASTTLSIILKLQDEASAAMQSVGDKLKSVGEGLTSAGKTLTTDISLPLAGVATAATYAAMQFQSSMELIHTQAGATQGEVETMSQAILNMVANGAEQAPQDLADALFHIESAGLRGTDALNALKAASEGADVGQANLTDVTNALVGAIATGIKGAGNYTDAMGTLSAIVGAGNMKMQDLTGALSTGILPAAKSVGLSLQDVGAALAVMTAQGVPAEDAATRLRMTFSLMESPTAAATKAFEQIGMSSTTLAKDMQSGGIVQAIDDLKTHLQDSGLTAIQQNDVIAKAFGGGRTSSAILSLLSSTDRLKSSFDQIGSSAGDFGGAVEAESKTAQASFDQMKASLSAAAIQLGNALIPLAVAILPKLASAITSIVNWFTNLPGPVQNGIIIFFGLLAVLGPLLVIIGTLITSVGTIITLIGTIAGVIGPAITAIGAVVAAIGLWPVLIGIAVVAVVAVIVTHWTQIKDFLTKIGSEIMDFIQDHWTLILNIVTFGNSAVVEYIIDHWTEIRDQTIAIWNGIKTFFSDTWNWVKSLFNTSLTDVSNLWNSVWNGMSDFIGNIWSTIKSVVKSGFNDIISAVNGFISALDAIHISMPSISIPGTKLATPSLNLGFNIPNIPMLADGGFVTRPTLALIGEAGPEAVMPLSRMGAQGGMGPTINITITGGYYLDQNAATQIGNTLAKQIVQQIRVRNYAF